ncbi:Cytochrome c5 [Duganella sp. CF458]|uniref:c-type cytochrome n=1 Tax=Duganella sp. CF458 TaxID=1884368 RepID=UPI0008E50221|nr:c-type cytochrome [Duganella sp. CF458]SFF64243.1 Cytochrome c5 [Duganella sp. CF458]
MRALLGMIMLAGLGACSVSKQEPAAADLQWAETSRPLEAQLAERYERSCMVCHGRNGSGAPLAGFAPHWKPRLDKGIDQLVRHASDGFNAMPAMGQCNDCSADDLRALTLFMARSGS